MSRSRHLSKFFKLQFKRIIMNTYKVCVNFNGVHQWIYIQADHIAYAQQIAEAQYGKENILGATSSL